MSLWQSNEYEKNREFIHFFIVMSMSKKNPKKKLCWNCEGSVSVQEANCPYCGVYLSSLENDDGKNSLFAPPYRLEEAEEESPVPTAPYTQEETSSTPISTAVSEGIEPTQNSMAGDLQAALLSLALLLTGSVLLLFGLALLLFSKDGVFTLRWDADYWYFFLAVGIPLMSYGCYMLTQVKENK